MKIKLAIALGVTIIAAAAGLSFYGEDLVRIYQLRRYPPIKAESKLGKAIAEENRWRRYQQALRRYRKVEGILERAERGGRDVRQLESRLPKIARYMERGNFEWADIHMNSIEMHLGRRPPRENVKLLNADDFEGARLSTPKGKRVKRRRRRAQ